MASFDEVKVTITIFVFGLILSTSCSRHDETSHNSPLTSHGRPSNVALKRIMPETPEQIDFYRKHHLAIRLEGSGEYESALEVYRELMRLSPGQDRYFQRDSVRILQKANRHQEASKIVRNLLLSDFRKDVQTMDWYAKAYESAQAANDELTMRIVLESAEVPEDLARTRVGRVIFEDGHTRLTLAELYAFAGLESYANRKWFEKAFKELPKESPKDIRFQLIELDYLIGKHSTGDALNLYRTIKQDTLSLVQKGFLARAEDTMRDKDWLPRQSRRSRRVVSIPRR